MSQHPFFYSFILDEPALWKGRHYNLLRSIQLYSILSGYILRRTDRSTRENHFTLVAVHRVRAQTRKRHFRLQTQHTHTHTDALPSFKYYTSQASCQVFPGVSVLVPNAQCRTRTRACACMHPDFDVPSTRNPPCHHCPTLRPLSDTVVLARSCSVGLSSYSVIYPVES